MMPTEIEKRYESARKLLSADAHDGPLVLVLWDRTENVGVGLDVVNTESDADALADEYMVHLDSRRYEIRVVALDFSDMDADDDDDTDEEEEA